jgi:hypothetical protein
LLALDPRALALHGLPTGGFTVGAEHRSGSIRPDACFETLGAALSLFHTAQVEALLPLDDAECALLAEVEGLDLLSIDLLIPIQLKPAAGRTALLCRQRLRRRGEPESDGSANQAAHHVCTWTVHQARPRAIV